ncbi:MAG: hypothetical protein AAGK23_07135 [Pseudomonadota bacterium]
MNLRKLMLAGGAVAALVGAPAQASIIDNPQFQVLGLVIVWGADSATGTTPVVSDFVINSGAGDADDDLIAGDVHAVVTGTLSPTPDAAAQAVSIGEFDAGGNFIASQSSTGVLDASDSFTAFTLTDDTDIFSEGLTQSSSFYVASNTAFAINATATAAPGATNFTLSDIGYDLSVTQTGDDGLAFGDDAQFPHTGGATGGVDASVTDLSQMGTNPIFVGNQRTAATPGTIASQSVRFDAVYTLGGTTGYDLSLGDGNIEANVVYTVFVP